MGLFGPSRKELGELLFNQKQELVDLRAALSTEKLRQRTFEQEIKQRRRTLQKPLQYATSNTDSTGRTKNSIYYGPQYDLAEIARALDIEPYISISVRKHREQILKEGFTIEGEDDKMVDYINKRLFEMSLVSGITTNQWLREFTTQLVTYASALLIISRNINKSTGNKIKLHGKVLNPIAAVYPIDVTSVKAELNDHGHPISWMQRIDNPVNSSGYGAKSVASWPNSDVILATIDKKSGFVFGTPYTLPVLDDVRALRRIEEISEIIGQKHAFPITHWKIGDKDDPPMEFDDGTTEVDVVRTEIENMPLEGGIVTSYRVDSEIQGAGNKVIDLVPYLNYFEKRVMGGLRISPEDLGRSEGAKASAVTVSQSLQDSSKDFQSVISDVLTHHLFLPLLLEGDFDVNKDNLVYIHFPLINREENRAQEAHAIDQYTNGATTRTELRKKLNLKELTEEDCKDCLPEQKHEWEMELARTAAAAKAAASPTPGAKTVANKTRPTNQSGRKPTKTRVKANDIHKEFYLDIISACYKDTRILLRSFIEKHGEGVSSEEGNKLDSITKDEELKSILSSFVTMSTIEARRALASVVQMSIGECMGDANIIGDYTIPKRTIDRFYKNTIEKSFKKFSASLYGSMQNNEVLCGIQDPETHPLVALSAICDLAQNEIKPITDRHIDIAHRFGYSRTAKAHGYSTIILTPEAQYADNGQEYFNYTVSLKIKDIPYNTLLATPEGMDYSISLGEKNLEAE